VLAFTSLCWIRFWILDSDIFFQLSFVRHHINHPVQPGKISPISFVVSLDNTEGIVEPRMVSSLVVANYDDVCYQFKDLSILIHSGYLLHTKPVRKRPLNLLRMQDCRFIITFRDLKELIGSHIRKGLFPAAAMPANFNLVD
jgi:hypothetical protein